MRAARRVASIVSATVLLISAGACGSDPGRPAPRPATVAAEQSTAERQDSLVDDALRAMHQAAVAGDRPGVDRAWQQLEQLARSDPAPKAPSTAADPYERAMDDFAFKRAPLYVQQISTTDGSHRVYAGVDRAAFCLLTTDARLAAVRGAYAPLDRRLRSAGVDDLQFVVVPLTRQEATLDRAFAVGRRATIRLTARGRRC